MTFGGSIYHELSDGKNTYFQFPTRVFQCICTSRSGLEEQHWSLSRTMSGRSAHHYFRTERKTGRAANLAPIGFACIGSWSIDRLQMGSLDISRFWVRGVFLFSFTFRLLRNYSGAHERLLFRTPHHREMNRMERTEDNNSSNKNNNRSSSENSQFEAQVFIVYLVYYYVDWRQIWGILAKSFEPT